MRPTKSYLPSKLAHNSQLELKNPSRRNVSHRNPESRPCRTILSTINYGTLFHPRHDSSYDSLALTRAGNRHPSIDRRSQSERKHVFDVSELWISVHSGSRGGRALKGIYTLSTSSNTNDFATNNARPTFEKADLITTTTNYIHTLQPNSTKSIIIMDAAKNAVAAAGASIREVSH